MTGPGSATCLQDSWGRENPTQTAPGEALTTRHRTGVQFPPSPPSGWRQRRPTLCKRPEAKASGLLCFQHRFRIPSATSGRGASALLDVRDRVHVSVRLVLGLLVGPFLLDGLVRFLGDLPVRRFVRHVALPNVGALNRPRACKVRLFCRECNWHQRRIRASLRSRPAAKSTRREGRQEPGTSTSTMPTNRLDRKSVV